LALPFAAVVVAAVLLAGCGGDDESGKTTGAATVQETATQTERTDAARSETTGTAQTTGTATSPEDQPGGAGDEEPARSQALFSGRGGRITPTLVRVPSFIAIRVVLRSADGRAYGLRFPGQTVRVNGARRSATADLAGLRPGKVLAGTGVNGSNSVRVEATAEPGP